MHCVRQCETGSQVPELRSSARKHYARDRLNDRNVLPAIEHVLLSYPLDDEDDPRRWLLLGNDEAGRLLEMVMLIFDTGNQLVIHAMKARPEYIAHLRESGI